MLNIQMQNKSKMYKNMQSDELAASIGSLVWESPRKMPAHFTSKTNGSSQSFMVDFEDIDPKDEYEMASTAWNKLGEYIKPEDGITEKQSMAILRCGEDIMIASYITQKIGRIEVIENVVSGLTEKNSGSWPDDLGIPQVFETESAKNWFDFCKEFGVQMAAGKASVHPVEGL